MKNTKNFTDFFKLNEMKLPVMKLEEITDDVTKVNDNTLKRVLVSYYKTYDDYIDCVNKNTHIFKVYDMVGDLMNNNRVSFDVCAFDKGDLERIKTNLVDFAIGEFHSLLPINLNIFGNDIKPSSFINKEELKAVFEGMFVEEEIVSIISNILNYNYAGKFNDFFIWDTKINNKVQTQPQTQPQTQIQTQSQSQTQIQSQSQPQIQTQPQIAETKKFNEFNIKTL